MRILVTGSREWVDRAAIEHALVGVGPGPHTIVHGACRGADTIATEIAAASGWTADAHLAEDHGNWPECGPIRNSHMVSLGADICLAFPLPGSKGTWDCIRKAVAAGIHTRIYPPPETA